MPAPKIEWCEVECPRLALHDPKVGPCRVCSDTGFVYVPAVNRPACSTCIGYGLKYPEVNLCPECGTRPQPRPNRP